MLESVAFLIKANLDEMDRHRPAAARLVASGGLAENRLLCRMLAASRSRRWTAAAIVRRLRAGSLPGGGMPPGFAARPSSASSRKQGQRLLARYLKWLGLMREAAGGG